MSRSLIGAFLALAAAVAAVPAHAGKGGPVDPVTLSPTVNHSGRNDNRLYAGINWNFGVRTGATAVVGFRGAKVRGDGGVHGYKAEISYILSGAPMGLGELRVKYLGGSRETQAEVGGGYSFAHQSFLLASGGQGPSINAELDYLLGKGILASVGVNTLGRVKKPRQSTTCPTGFTLSDGTCFQDQID